MRARVPVQNCVRVRVRRPKKDCSQYCFMLINIQPSLSTGVGLVVWLRSAGMHAGIDMLEFTPQSRERRQTTTHRRKPSYIMSLTSVGATNDTHHGAQLVVNPSGDLRIYNTPVLPFEDTHDKPSG